MQSFEEILQSGQINHNYDMNFSEVEELIRETTKNAFIGLSHAFYFGYIKGQRALKAELKRKKAKQ